MRSFTFSKVPRPLEVVNLITEYNVRAQQVTKADGSAVDAMLGTVSAPESATGTTEQAIEKLTRMRELGCEYAIMYFPDAAYDRTGIELFEREVIPALA